MIIGVDPHKGSHTATALSPATNAAAASLRIDATLAGYRQLLRWGKAFPERQWAIENAHGLGQHLAQWLIARGETVVDVRTTATARVRELSRGGRRKNDVLDASAAASGAAAHGDSALVAPEDETTVFALLEERRANLAGSGSGSSTSSTPCCETLFPEEPVRHSRPRRQRPCCAAFDPSRLPSAVVRSLPVSW